MAEISLRNVTKTYSDGTEAVKQLDLDVPDGEFGILVGPSGCGKSTALRMVAGLEGITSGELLIDGEQINDRAPRDRDVAMVFQNYALYPHMTVRKNMSFALKMAGVRREEIVKRVEEAADILDLRAHLDRRPGRLSGGQRQRVAMGRAIVRSPKAFLMDEPLSNLDAKLRVQMRIEISRIQQRLGTTTIYVTHDQTEAMTLGDWVAVMRDGVVQQIDTPRNLYDHPKNLFVAGFIGSPSMNFLPGRLEDGKLKLPFGQAALPQGLLEPNGSLREVIVGVRPEAFEDAVLEPNREGVRFTVRASVVESLGAEQFAYFDVHAHEVQSPELAALAADAGIDSLHFQPGEQQLVARLSRYSQAESGGTVDLVLDSRQIKLFDPRDGRSLLALP